MKKNIYSIFLGLAAIAFFASCNENEVNQIKEPVIVDGKILLSASIDTMTPEASGAKYSFNAAGTPTDPIPNVFFDANDSVYINGLPYAVFPYMTEYPETDTSSAHARIWADVSSSGDYKGLYPKSAFSSISNIDQPEIVVPDTVTPFPTDLYYLGSIFKINPAKDGRIMPMTAYVRNQDFNDMLQFKNTMGMFLFSLRYNFPFGACIDPLSGSASGYPYVIVNRIEITTPSVALTGTGAITDPYSNTPSAAINSNVGHKIIYKVETPTGIQPTQRGAQDLLFLPIVPFAITNATIDIYFTTRSLITGEERNYKYSKTVNNKLHAERSTINNLIINFSTAADFSNCTRIN